MPNGIVEKWKNYPTYDRAMLRFLQEYSVGVGARCKREGKTLHEAGLLVLEQVDWLPLLYFAVRDQDIRSKSAIGNDWLTQFVGTRAKRFEIFPNNARPEWRSAMVFCLDLPVITEEFVMKYAKLAISSPNQERGYISSALKLRILQRQKFKCYNCSLDIGPEINRYHIDHILARSLVRERRLLDIPANYGALCDHCNLVKGDKSLGGIYGLEGDGVIDKEPQSVGTPEEIRRDALKTYRAWRAEDRAARKLYIEIKVAILDWLRRSLC